MPTPTTVVKCGGGPALNRDAICADIAALARAGRRIVLVHGGAADVDALAARLGVPQQRLTTPSGSSSRYTDPATLEVLMLALAGKVKPVFVGALARHGARAVGLTGMDGGLITARRPTAYRAVLHDRPVVIRDDHNGRITAVDPALLGTLLDAGVVPVVSPPALDLDGQPVNVDADRAAAAIAVALGATELILLTSAPGVLGSVDDESSVLATYEIPEAGYADGVVGGMRVKLIAARHALAGDVAGVRIADGRGARPVTDAMAGAGTSVRLAPAAAVGN